ncbi:MAG: hypothetical protein M1833_001234 [Piccolia ochrophora]|nr:MAG: hypothetical protein M1833_001234 [Piccolia ochrophora]
MTSTSVNTNLPDSQASCLVLAHPTADEKLTICKANAESWRGPLSQEAYLDREKTLFNQSLTLDGGITHWILVRGDAPEGTRVVLASCETIRKRAVVACASAAEDGAAVKDVICHGVASVFTEPCLRGRGYAGRMMQELRTTLQTWHVDRSVNEGHEVLMSVLFSDIGKEFYSRHGWHPFPSSHVCLPSLPSSLETHLSQLPPSRPVLTSSIQKLCLIDEKLIRESIRWPLGEQKARVGLIPDIETISWHLARQDFVSQHLFGSTPEVNGAKVGEEAGRRAWCIWARSWYSNEGANDADNTLQILRLVVDDDLGTVSSDDCEGVNAGFKVKMVASLFIAAQKEAAKWHTSTVQLWNPSPIAVQAAKLVSELTSSGEKPRTLESLVIDRESDNITSMLWYGSHSRYPTLRSIDWTNVDWIANEKYGWC